MAIPGSVGWGLNSLYISGCSERIHHPTLHDLHRPGD